MTLFSTVDELNSALYFKRDKVKSSMVAFSMGFRCFFGVDFCPTFRFVAIIKNSGCCKWLPEKRALL